MKQALNSLGFAKDPAATRVVVAMSGGVDSSVTAALLDEAGYEVIGITLQLYDHGQEIQKKGACCAGQDIYDARRVADSIGIPHYVLDYESRFRESVIDRFADSYLAGETPIPCVLCNQGVKFQDLLGCARDLGADALATGHYVRREIGPVGPGGDPDSRGRGTPELHRARDLARDQSYFLFATTAEQLEFLRFPLGGLDKDETRRLAARFALPVAAKPDSQDICFVPDGNYAGIVEKLRPGAVEPGDIVDLSGAVLGRHQGIIHYTVGQRRGLGLGNLALGESGPGGLGGGEALYVVQIEREHSRIVVGPKADLARTRVHVDALNWLGPGQAPEDGLRAEVKLRSTQPPVAATIYRRGQDGSMGPAGAEVVLDEPEYGVAPGQACVIYLGERVLGGGWITREDAVLAA